MGATQYPIRNPMPDGLQQLTQGMYNAATMPMQMLLGPGWNYGTANLNHSEQQKNNKSNTSNNWGYANSLFDDGSSNRDSYGVSTLRSTASSDPYYGTARAAIGTSGSNGANNSGYYNGDLSWGTNAYYTPGREDNYLNVLLNQAKGLSEKATQGQSTLMNQNAYLNSQLPQYSQMASQLTNKLPEMYNQNDDILNQMLNTINTGNVPTQLTDALNASVNRELQSGMGSMLNNLGNRGVLNSSITQSGINNLAGNAADAYNDNYMNVFNSVLNGLNSSLAGAQGNVASVLSGIGTMGDTLNKTTNSMNTLSNIIGEYGKIPEQAYTNAYAPLMPAYNLWKDWMDSYYGHEDFHTAVDQESDGGKK